MRVLIFERNGELIAMLPLQSFPIRCRSQAMSGNLRKVIGNNWVKPGLRHL